jgi:hypothetical protein
MVTVCTFNANNLFVRYRFAENFPGAPANAPAAPSPANPPTTASTKFGFLPAYEPGSFDVFNADQRQLAALAVCPRWRPSAAGPRRSAGDRIADRVAGVQRTLPGRALHAGASRRQPRLRQIDVGVLAAPTVQLDQVRTHVDLLAKPGEQFKPDWPWQFSRDCLEVETRLAGGRTLTVFVHHFKSKFVQPRHGQTKDDIAADRKAAAEYRLRQSTAVLDLVRARFPGNGFAKRWFAVAGDFNSLSAEPPAQTFATAGLDDVIARLPADQRWTEYYSGGRSVGQLDYLFLSPALAAATAGQLPAIERSGIGMRERSKTDGGPLPKLARLEVSDDLPPAASIDFRFPRFPAVTPTVKASGHCQVFFDLP